MARIKVCKEEYKEAPYSIARLIAYNAETLEKVKSLRVETCAGDADELLERHHYKEWFIKELENEGHSVI